MSSRKLDEAFMKAVDASKKRKGKRISSEALAALGASKGSLEESFAKALNAVKGRTGREPQSAFEVSRKDIPADLSRKVYAAFNKHLRKSKDEIEAYNKTLLELAPEIGPRRSLISRLASEMMKKGGRRLVKRGKQPAPRPWNVLRIDAWRDSEGGWTENQSFKSGTLDLPPYASNRDILKAMREAGYLSQSSAGSVAIEDMGGDTPYMWIIDKNSREPLFAVTKEHD